MKSGTVTSPAFHWPSSAVSAHRPASCGGALCRPSDQQNDARLNNPAERVSGGGGARLSWSSDPIRGADMSDTLSRDGKAGFDYPGIEPRPEAVEYGGVRYQDPFRWLEEDADPVVAAC